MYNKVILVGNLSRDIELRYAQTGTAIARTGLATNRRRRDSSGKNIDEVMFIDITFFGRSGEIANQYLRKGSKILVEGRLQFEQWVDHNNQKQSRHSVIVENMQMLDSQGGGNGGSSSPQSQSSNQSRQTPRDVDGDISDDEAPF
jgi:single-strand DNA-binding protein